MLCLSRKRNETIVIGEGVNRVVITICDIDRDRVRVGVACDRSIPVNRGELLPVALTTQR